MDVGKVIKRAAEITWRWKILWVLGFLVALGKGGNGGGGGGSSASGGGEEWSNLFTGLSGQAWLVIALLVFVFFVIGIAIWALSIVARGGLIAAVDQIEQEGDTTLSDAWRAGRRRFWTLFGLDILAALPIIALVLVGLIAGIIAIAGGAATLEEGGAIAAGVLCGVPLCCSGIILAIVLAQIKLYGERAAVLEDLSWIEAFKQGFEVLKANPGPTLILWVVFLLIGLAVAAVVGGTVLAGAIPGVALLAGPGRRSAWVAAPLCMIGGLAILFFALVGSIVETFTSATWTLAYRELTGMAGPEGEMVEEIEDVAVEFETSDEDIAEE